MSTDDEDPFTEDVSEPCPEGRGITIDDFIAYLPSHVYIYMPCREVWIGESVNSVLPPMPVLDKNGKPKRVNGKVVTISATKWLDRNRRAVQMTWCPGFPMLIHGRMVVDGGWIEREEVTGLDRWPKPANRTSLGCGRCRAHSQECCGIGRAGTGRHSGRRQRGRGAVAASNPQRACRVRGGARSSRYWLRRQLGTARRQCHRICSV